MHLGKRHFIPRASAALEHTVGKRIGSRALLFSPATEPFFQVGGDALEFLGVGHGVFPSLCSSASARLALGDLGSFIPSLTQCKPLVILPLAPRAALLFRALPTAPQHPWVSQESTPGPCWPFSPPPLLQCPPAQSCPEIWGSWVSHTGSPPVPRVLLRPRGASSRGGGGGELGGGGGGADAPRRSGGVRPLVPPTPEPLTPSTGCFSRRGWMSGSTGGARGPAAPQDPCPGAGDPRPCPPGS